MKAPLHFFIQTCVPHAVSFYQSNLGTLAHVVRVSGYSHAALADILDPLIQKAKSEAIPVQILHNCLDDTLQGVILPEQSAGVYGFNIYDSEEINIAAASDPQSLFSVKKYMDMARIWYQSAKSIHDQQEKIYIHHMDFEKADRLAEETTERLWGGRRSGHREHRTDRFFGASTVKGSVNYIPDIIRDIPTRFYIKGRPGTGKSTFLKKIVRDALSRGFDTEVYHCSFDPDSLDMVAVRELGLCLFDSTAPHEYFPTLAGEETIDLYKQCVTPGTDEKYAGELNELETVYKEKLAVGSEYLRKAKEAYDRFEASLPILSAADKEELSLHLIRELL